MLERFTPDELLQIKKELGLIDPDYTRKKNIGSIKTINALFPKKYYPNGDTVRLNGLNAGVSGKNIALKIHEDIVDICDLTFENFCLSATKWGGGDKQYYKRKAVPNELVDSYEELFDEIVKIISKYREKYNA